MTYKYLQVRRAMYEENPTKILKLNRSNKDMEKLFKLPLWILLCFLLMSIIITFFLYNSILILIPSAVIVIITILSQTLREEYLYNDSIRKDELCQIMKAHDEYVVYIWRILESYGIDTSEKVIKLKFECEAALIAHKEKFSKINNKIIDMLLGVPLNCCCMLYR